jgi:hypothetical protein
VLIGGRRHHGDVDRGIGERGFVAPEGANAVELALEERRPRGIAARELAPDLVTPRGEQARMPACNVAGAKEHQPDGTVARHRAWGVVHAIEMSAL